MIPQQCVSLDEVSNCLRHFVAFWVCPVTVHSHEGTANSRNSPVNVEATIVTSQRGNLKKKKKIQGTKYNHQKNLQCGQILLEEKCPDKQGSIVHLFLSRRSILLRQNFNVSVKSPNLGHNNLNIWFVLDCHSQDVQV